MAPDETAGRKPAALHDILGRLNPIALAFSGGLDSRFLAHAASQAGCDVLAIHITGPHIAAADSSYARAWTNSAGLPFHEIYLNPLEHPDVANNAKNRCYICKGRIFSVIRQYLRESGQERRALCDGGNRDDYRSFRPGLMACREAGVISPLARAALGKAEIRQLAKVLGLSNPDQAPRPCLLTRFPYGYPVQEKGLSKIAGAEQAIQDFFATAAISAPDFRLRFTPAPQLHLSFLPENTDTSLRSILLAHGIKDCEIKIMPDLSGFFDSVNKQP